MLEVLDRALVDICKLMRCFAQFVNIFFLHLK